MSFPYERCTKVCDKLVFIPLNDHREALKIVASPIMTTTATAAGKNLPNQFPISISTRN